jgi:hypothetical protein
MIQLLLSGGAATLVVLALGLATLVQSISFLRDPREGRVGALRAFSQATVWATVGATAAALGAVFHKVPANEDWAQSPDLPLIVMMGVGESMVPLVLGALLLTLSALASGIGFRRMGL